MRTPNSTFEIERKRDATKRVYKQFREDCNETLPSAELIRSLSSCSDGESKRFRFLPIKEDSKINISERVLQDLDHSDEEMEVNSLNWVIPKEVHVVIDMRHLNKTLPPINIQSSKISKLRDIFMSLTGQAAVSFIAYSPMASSLSVSFTHHPLYLIVAANAMAFLFLLLSFLLRGKKPVAAKKITGAIGIAAAVVVFFLMMGMFFLPIKTM